ncbi:hypothetical protein BGZ63DRAFT_207948 [Mariannaea sp. PMI_226]|nr:hypothetical protein BGZ63DRAFT_207948 [Mariannaea sp. PMI_226]
MHSDHAGSRQAHPISGAPLASQSRHAVNPTPRYLSNTTEQHPVRSYDRHDRHDRQESVGSIVNDPFFQQRFSSVEFPHSDESDDSSVYQSLPEDNDHDNDNGGGGAKNDHNLRERDSNDNIPSRHWLPPRRESLTAPPSSYWVCMLFSPRTHGPLSYLGRRGG